MLQSKWSEPPKHVSKSQIQSIGMRWLTKIISPNARLPIDVGAEHKNVRILLHIRVADIIHHHSPCVHKCLGNKYRRIFCVPSETIFHLTPHSLPAQANLTPRDLVYKFMRECQPSVRPPRFIPPANLCELVLHHNVDVRLINQIMAHRGHSMEPASAHFKEKLNSSSSSTSSSCILSASYRHRRGRPKCLYSFGRTRRSAMPRVRRSFVRMCWLFVGGAKANIEKKKIYREGCASAQVRVRGFLPNKLRGCGLVWAVCSTHRSEPILLPGHYVCNE